MEPSQSVPTEHLPTSGGNSLKPPAQPLLRPELERFYTRLESAIKTSNFGEIHGTLLRVRGWMDYEEATTAERGFWLGVLTTCAAWCPNREAAELLRRYSREWKADLTSRTS